MSEITDPQAVKFCNENGRIMADAMLKFKRTADQFLLNVVRDFEQRTSGNQDSDSIQDGAASDGRNPLTKANVAQLKFVVEQMVGCINTDDRLQLTEAWGVNTQPYF